MLHCCDYYSSRVCFLSTLVTFSTMRLCSVCTSRNSCGHVLTQLSGLTLLSISFFGAGHDLLGAICFVLSLGFKQMALYYAPAVGSYLIAKCLSLGVHEGFVCAFSVD